MLLDTELLPERERRDALHCLYEDQNPPRRVQLASEPLRHRVERVSLTPHTHVLRTGGSPLQVVRTERHVRREAPECLAIGWHRQGQGLVSVAGRDTDLPAGHLNCVDMTRPYRVAHTTVNQHDVLVISNLEAGVSVDSVRAAAPALRASPMYDLVRAHVAGLFAAARSLPSEPRLLTGQATSALVRALVTTAAGSKGGYDVLQDTMVARLTMHMEARLADRALTVESVAVAHSISVRHFYNVWATDHELTPAQWIIRRRLERAKQLLLHDPPRSISGVARRCGFADASHFGRRFREAFGTTPGDWRDARRGAGWPRQP